ncbi:MAG: hypothetical protein ACAH10_04525 [Methylophilaceae bacterium]
MNSMRLKFWIPALLLSLMLGGCAGFIPLQRPQTAQITRGADQIQVDNAVGKATLLASHTFSANGKQFLAKHYDLLTGTRQDMNMRCHRRRGCTPVFYDVPIMDAYVVVFEQPSDKVFAWGMVEELSRSPDDAVSSIMPALKASYEAARRKQ